MNGVSVGWRETGLMRYEHETRKSRSPVSLMPMVRMNLMPVVKLTCPSSNSNRGESDELTLDLAQHCPGSSHETYGVSCVSVQNTSFISGRNEIKTLKVLNEFP